MILLVQHLLHVKHTIKTYMMNDTVLLLFYLYSSSRYGAGHTQGMHTQGMHTQGMDTLGTLLLPFLRCGIFPTIPGEPLRTPLSCSARLCSQWIPRVWIPWVPSYCHSYAKAPPPPSLVSPSARRCRALLVAAASGASHCTSNARRPTTRERRADEALPATPSSSCCNST
jgi:hypothetical protein